MNADFVWGIMLLDTAAVWGCYWIIGLSVKRMVRKRWVREKYGKSYVDFSNGLANLIMSVPVLSVLIFIFAILGGDEGLSSWPLIAAGTVYTLASVALIVGFLHWWKNIKPVLNGGTNDRVTNDNHSDSLPSPTE